MSLAKAIETQQNINEGRVQESLGLPKPGLTDEQRALFVIVQRWCAERGLRDFPTAPSTAAAFISQVGAADVIPYCQSIAAVHDALGLANPIATFAVKEVLGRLKCETFPHSWNGEDKLIFATLDPITRAIILRRETERDSALRRKQNQLSEQMKRERKASSVESESEASQGST